MNLIYQNIYCFVKCGKIWLFFGNSRLYG